MAVKIFKLIFINTKRRKREDEIKWNRILTVLKKLLLVDLVGMDSASRLPGFGICSLLFSVCFNKITFFGVVESISDSVLTDVGTVKQRSLILVP